MIAFFRCAPALRAAGIISGRFPVGYAAIAEATATTIAIAALLGACLSAHRVSSERASGVLASLLVSPVSRRSWLLARACSGAIIASGAVVLVAGVAWASGAALLDLGDVREQGLVIASAAEARQAVLLGTALLVPPLVSVALLAVAAGTIARGPPLAVAVAVTAVVAASFVGSAEPRIGPYLFTSYLPILGRESAIATAGKIAQGFADADFDRRALVRGVVVPIATALAALVVAAVSTGRERLAWREE
jgi:hypothetical protein